MAVTLPDGQVGGLGMLFTGMMRISAMRPACPAEA
jgi:hypothetical protein